MRTSIWRRAGRSTFTIGIAGAALLAFSQPLTLPAQDKKSKEYATWLDYEGTADSAQYSSLTQINKSNVSQLKQVWFYPAGIAGFRFGFNPVIVDDTMYVLGKNNSIVALDAATGETLWTHETNARTITSRGINYWESKDRSDRRLLFATDQILHAIDAKTGQTIDSFGTNGNVDLREGLGRDVNMIRNIQSGTPGRIFENLLILGSSTGEDYGSPPGDIRAYDVRTGKMVWIFHTVPHPGEPGYDTWPPDAYKYIGGTNDWGGMSLDEKRGIVYIPLGSPTYDFYGVDRIGQDLYADCLLALDARTGKHLWHFQDVHHDLWDYDLTASPKLLTIKHNGKNVDVVTQAGKTGYLYVLDRVTGKPIWPIVEKPVPASDIPGEQAWPTQPVPTAPPPFARLTYSPNDVNPYLSDTEREEAKEYIADSHNEGMFTPPGLRNTLEPAGNSGGANWGSAAADPTTGWVYIRNKNAPTMLKLDPKPPRFSVGGTPATQGHAIYLQNCATCHTSTLQGQPPAIPSLVDVVSRLGADQVRTTVQNGLSPMPAFPDLTSRDLDSLIAYLTAPSTSQLSPQIVAYLSAPTPPQPLTPDKVQYRSGYGYMMTPDGLPQISPPWGTLAAYDLNKGTLVWEIPDGGVTALEDKGIKNTGSVEPRGGVVVTAGGLIFDGTKSDQTMRAYDKETGKVLWEVKLPAGPEGIPAVYMIDGREYVVQAANVLTQIGAAPISPDELAKVQGYYVFALPSVPGKAESK